MNGQDKALVAVGIVLLVLFVLLIGLILNSDAAVNERQAECHVLCGSTYHDECVGDCLVNEDYVRDRLNG